jgi:hypothetical protein
MKIQPLKFVDGRSLILLNKERFILACYDRAKGALRPMQRWNRISRFAALPERDYRGSEGRGLPSLASPSLFRPIF